MTNINALLLFNTKLSKILLFILKATGLLFNCITQIENTIPVKYFGLNPKEQDGLEWIVGFYFVGTLLSCASLEPVTFLLLRKRLVPEFLPFSGQYLVLDILSASFLTFGLIVDWIFAICTSYMCLVNVNFGYKWLYVLTTAW